MSEVTGIEQFIAETQRTKVSLEWEDKQRIEQAIASKKKTMTIQARDLITRFRFEYPDFNFIQWNIRSSAQHQGGSEFTGSYLVSAGFYDSSICLTLNYGTNQYGGNSSRDTNVCFVLCVAINLAKFDLTESQLRDSSIRYDFELPKEGDNKGDYSPIEISSINYRRDKNFTVAVSSAISQSIDIINAKILKDGEGLDIFNNKYDVVDSEDVEALIKEWEADTTAFELDMVAGYERYNGQLYQHKMEFFEQKRREQSELKSEKRDS